MQVYGAFNKNLFYGKIPNFLLKIHAIILDNPYGKMKHERKPSFTQQTRLLLNILLRIIILKSDKIYDIILRKRESILLICA